MKNNLVTHVIQITDYEVLQQKNGDICLTLNAGVLLQTPIGIRIIGNDLHFFCRDTQVIGGNKEDVVKSIGYISSLKNDILDLARSKKGLLVVELSTFGVHSAQSLSAFSRYR